MNTYKYSVKGVTIESNKKLSLEKQNEYVDYLQKKYKGEMLVSVNLKFDGENVTCDYVVEPIQFERIRRITGYLVGTLDRFNNGKKAEEYDRIKHSSVSF